MMERSEGSDTAVMRDQVGYSNCRRRRNCLWLLVRLYLRGSIFEHCHDSITQVHMRLVERALVYCTEASDHPSFFTCGSKSVGIVQLGPLASVISAARLNGT